MQLSLPFLLFITMTKMMTMAAMATTAAATPPPTAAASPPPDASLSAGGGDVGATPMDKQMVQSASYKKLF